MADGIVAQALDRIVVRILEDPFQTRRPDDDALVGTARSEALAISGVGHAINVGLVAFQGLHKRPIRSIVH